MIISQSNIGGTGVGGTSGCGVGGGGGGKVPIEASVEGGGGLGVCGVEVPEGVLGTVAAVGVESLIWVYDADD